MPGDAATAGRVPSVGRTSLAGHHLTSYLHAMRALLLSLLLFLLAPSAGAQGSGRAVILVRVTDAEAKEPIANVRVGIRALGANAATDSTGRAVLRGLRDGAHLLELRAVGYEPLASDIVLAAGDTLEAELSLHRIAQALPTVAVVDSAVLPGFELFEQRRKLGFGQFLGSTQLEAEGTRMLSDVLTTRFHGVRVLLASDGQRRYIVSTRVRTNCLLSSSCSHPDPAIGRARLPKDACLMELYVDGVYLADREISHIKTEELGAIEIYNSAIPAQFRRPGAECGVVLLWTKLPPGR